MRKKKFDDGGGRERFASAGGHFKQKSRLPCLDRCLDGLRRALLVRAHEAQAVFADEFGLLCRVLPSCRCVISGHLGAGDVVQRDVFSHQSRRVWLKLGIAFDGAWRRKAGDEVRVAVVQIPQVMQVAIAQDNEAAILRFGVFAGLLFADERVLVFGLGFEHNQREALFIKQQEVDKALAAGLVISTHGIHLCLGDLDVGLQRDVGFALWGVKKPPTSGLQQVIDLDPGLGFFGGHSHIVR